MKLKLSFLFAISCIYSWSQTTTQTFDTSGTFTVPAGVTSLSVQAWGGGGSGGGARPTYLLVVGAGAGGGGGAYASSSISVTPGAVLNIVVAGVKAGVLLANGVNGDNSTITGFESSILAAGGSGGVGYLSGVEILMGQGGAGGTVEASAGTVRMAGVKGGPRWSGLTVPLIGGPAFNSGAGGAGANSGGAGGAAVVGDYNGGSPGNPGSAPGGGGSGSVNNHLSGAGGAGRVIISYENPTFSLASSTENNVSVYALNKALNIDSSDRNINQVFVYDLSGNVVYKKDAISDSKLTINNLRSNNNQVLVVKVILDNNKVETKKVIY